MNLIGIMFVILNLRNIIDNFYKYGLQFHRAPDEFIELHTVAACIGTSFFPLMIYFLEKIKFRRLISKKMCVIIYLSRTYLNT